MRVELPQGFRSIPREEVDFEHPTEDEELPNGTFFASVHGVEGMTAADATAYAQFFALVLQASPHYSEEEKGKFIPLRTPEKIIQKIGDRNWILLTIKDASGQMLGSLEAELIANNAGEKFGNIKWTLAHPEHRRQGVGTGLKNEFERIIRERGCSGIITAIKDDNIASIKMNRALGVLRDDSFPRTSNGSAWYTKRFTIGNET